MLLVLLIACVENEIKLTDSGDTGEPPYTSLDSGNTEAEDNDQDGYTADEDCDDADSTVYPGAPELCDELDNDCDGETDEDVTNTWYLDGDGDGYGTSGVSMQSCENMTGYTTDSGDCDDSNDAVYPGAMEICDGVDNDCDAATEDAGIAVDGQGAATIQAAVDMASPGMRIDICPGTYVEDVRILQDVTLNGVGGPSATFLTGTGTDAVVSITGASVTLQGLTISGGIGMEHPDTGVRVGGGVAAYMAGDITIVESTVSGNEAEQGGGVFLGPYGNLALSNATISDNQASTGGGLHIQMDGTIFVDASVIEGNEANDGGGLYLEATADGSAIIGDMISSLNDNVAAASGGGLCVASEGYALQVIDMLADGNSAISGGGAAVLSGTVDLDNLALTGNSADNDGGGLYVEAATVTLYDVGASGNTATNGGGAAVAGGAITAYGASDLVENEATINGGGLYVYGGTWYGGTLQRNSALQGGGGYLDGTIAATSLDAVSVSENTASQGGGLYLHDVSVNNLVVELNTAELGGGVASASTNDISFSIIEENTANTTGGGAWVLDGTMIVFDTDWGMDAGDNQPDDVNVDGGASYYDYEIGASFTCSHSSGACE